MSVQKTVFNKLFKKEELASQKVELADIASFNKLMADAESKLDLVTKGKTAAKDGLLSWKIKSQDAMRAFDVVMAEYADLLKAAKALGLEVPPNIVSSFDRAKFQSSDKKSAFNLADKLLKSIS